jgi:FkbM family methyltransferase
MMLAWIFRTLNARIITTRFEIVRKPLKVLLLISRRFYLRSLKKSSGQPDWVVIDNFDKDIKLRVDRSRTMGASLYWTGFHEIREFIFLHRFLKPEMTALDIGANLGEYSVFMAKRLVDGKVIAFEPLPAIRKQLRDNVARNNFSNVSVLDYGLSHQDQVLEIHELDDVHEGLGTLYPRDQRSKNVYNATFKSLDSQVESLGIDKIDFIKIDVEGSELNAMKGAKQSLLKWKPRVMIEINEITYSAAGYSVDDVKIFFEGIGFTPHNITKYGRLEQIDQLPKFGNIVFVALK